MRNPVSTLFGAAMLVLQVSSATAAEYASWDEYQKANRYVCPGPFDTLKTPLTLTLAGRTYRHTGATLAVQDGGVDTKLSIGVVSAIKDATAGTKQNLSAALAWFKKAGAAWVVANGDLALEEIDLQELLETLGNSGLPTLIMVGNSDSKSSFARVYKDVATRYPTLINGNLVRQVVLDQVELWTLPGYHDRAFVRQGAACLYGQADLDALAALTPTANRAVVLVAHGPPQGSGKGALDWMSDKKNVGDPAMTAFLQAHNIAFGAFGHILEAGGSAVGKDMSTPIGPGKLVASLYVNAGSVSADPWRQNDGSTAHGMAVLLSFDGGRAKYEVRRFSPPPSK